MTTKVCISAGHGSNTSGKRTPDGYREHQFNYPTAEYVAQYLKEYKDVEVLKVYESVRDVPLSERTSRANQWGADTYISIHYNAYGSGWNNANGIETLVYSSNSRGYRIAKDIHPKVIDATNRSDRGIKFRPDLWEMRKTNSNVGAVLVECGFMTNRKEAELMKSDSYRRTVARAIVNGLVDHFNLKKKVTNPNPANPPTTGDLYRVQIGAFSSYQNSKSYERLAITKGFVDAFTRKEGNLYKTQIGAFSHYDNAIEQRNKAIQRGFTNAWITT